MPVCQRLEFLGREDNIIYPVAFLMRPVRPAGSAEEGVRRPAADPLPRIAAISCKDSILMVGG